MKKAIIICIGMSLSTLGFSQQDAMFTQYMFNTLSVNPAYAGSADYFSATALYRNQWVNFEGAPTTQTITGHAPLKYQSISLGGSIVNDSHGPVKQTGFYADVSYRIFLDKSKLAFGLKGGMNLFQANLLSLNPNQDGDVAFTQNIESKTLPNFGFGMLWYSERFQVGISAPKLLKNKLMEGRLPDFADNTEKQHFFIIAGYVFDINPYLKFKPSLLAKAVQGAPPGFDFTANFLFYDKLCIDGKMP